MEALLRAEGNAEFGGTPLLMHNERLSDPLDPIARALGEFTKKRAKTDVDHLEISRIEFLGGLYINKNGPCIPGWNIVRALQDGAKRIRRGKDILRAVTPILESADLKYDGPRDPEDLFATGHYLRKGVVVSQKKTMRTRPFFTEWSFELPIEVDAEVLDPDVLAQCWTTAGKYEGIGDMRPIYGRFKASVESWTSLKGDTTAAFLQDLAATATITRVRADDSAREDRVGTVEGANAVRASRNGHGDKKAVVIRA